MNVCRFDLQPSSFLVPSFLPSSLPERSDSLPSRPSFADLFAKQNATESRVNIPLPIPRILSFFLFTVRDFPFSSFSGLIWWIYLRIFVEECLRGMIEFGFEDRYDYIIDEWKFASHDVCTLSVESVFYDSLIEFRLKMV